MDKTSYERALRRTFPYLSRIGDYAEIFRSYPLRVRSQQEIEYYEIGSANISPLGEIEIGKDDILRSKANTTAFEKLRLRSGDIVLPYRSKRLQPGLYRYCAHPLVPNPGLVVIRSGSLERGIHLMACLALPLVKTYIETELISKEGKLHKLKFDALQSLLIPAIEEKALPAILDIDAQRELYRQAGTIQIKLEEIVTQEKMDLLLDRYRPMDENTLDQIREHLDRIRNITDEWIKRHPLAS